MHIAKAPVGMMKAVLFLLFALSLRQCTSVRISSTGKSIEPVSTFLQLNSGFRINEKNGDPHSGQISSEVDSAEEHEVDRLANRMKNESQPSTETIAVDGGSRTGTTGGSPKDTTGVSRIMLQSIE